MDQIEGQKQAFTEHKLTSLIHNNAFPISYVQVQH